MCKKKDREIDEVNEEGRRDMKETCSRFCCCKLATTSLGEGVDAVFDGALQLARA